MIQSCIFFVVFFLYISNASAQLITIVTGGGVADLNEDGPATMTGNGEFRNETL